MPQDVCQDASLRLTVTKLVSPDQLVVVLFLTNQKQASLGDVTLSLKPSSNLTVSPTGIGSRGEGGMVVLAAINFSRFLLTKPIGTYLYDVL